ncbi:tRNA nucleotidyltransferase (CCA-adding enzyme) [Thermolongibacillus altinsuensis]|jgi:tRNA nucleotidyltransferase (CCA-adding enzyme)|uniref:CCA-adding enzyme n=1 Tax=Thermolongibacillus altinsuensis TaxID=575256 RepID=A0A4R1QIA1_9BACL|nr:CCA tRNA nucleotidyltransferase [Thermolongibacillus altinsuensis]TCL53206.1 tRNA nucleotidyltransferase (CCA-adding enzyme) [Thermolongibacillus altinsuensis]GMB07901.1 CCA-adding enzyme [Thermolongibacillus altinsuensis]
MNEKFRQALPIIETLKRHGHEAYFVGGAVRDFLLDRPIGDVDIATSALPQEVISLFPKTVPVGIEHGTVMVIYKGTSYEVTTFRTEGRYEDYRRPAEVTFVRSLEEDLKRRDFTMNAIAMNERGELIDPFGGKAALEKQLIETVGAAAERFSEDALRMMRALRFVSQLGFSLAVDTKQAIEQHGHLLEKIAIERITVEFEKMLCGPFVHQAFPLLIETNLFLYLPGLSEKKEPLAKMSAYQWRRLHDRIEAWALFVYLLDVDPHSFLRKWKLPNHVIRDVSVCLQGLTEIREKDDWTIDRLYRYGQKYMPLIETVRATLKDESAATDELAARLAALPIQERKQLAVNGNDVMAWFGRERGRWIAETLETIERAVLHGEVKNEKEAIKEWLLACNQKQEKNC